MNIAPKTLDRVTTGTLATIAAISIVATIAIGSIDHTKEFKNAAAHYICKNDVCDVYLNDHEITAGLVKQSVNVGLPAEYNEVRDLYTKASNTTVIRLHLAGPGGAMSGLMVLYNAIQNSKAQTISVIDDDVASADAVLAIASKEIEVSPYAVLMFHRSSALNYKVEEVCAEEKDKLDRGQSAYKKCQDDFNSMLQKDEKFFSTILPGVLSKDQFNDVMSGGDVYVPAPEIKKNFDKKKR